MLLLVARSVRLYIWLETLPGNTKQSNASSIPLAASSIKVAEGQSKINWTKIFIALVLLTLTMATPNYVRHVEAANTAQVDVHPILAGWGGARIEDTAQNLTGPVSQVFPGERASDFEQILEREQSLGYNTIRASFAPYCAVQFGINPTVPPDFMGNYTDVDLARA